MGRDIELPNKCCGRCWNLNACYEFAYNTYPCPWLGDFDEMDSCAQRKECKEGAGDCPHYHEKENDHVE